MAVNLQQQLESVGVKMRLVAEKYRTLSAVKSDLESDNVRLKAEIISRDREIPAGCHYNYAEPPRAGADEGHSRRFGARHRQVYRRADGVTSSTL